MAAPPVQAASRATRTVDDFDFGRELGEGSYSTVVLATEKSNGKEFAVKILSKRHIIRENKVKHVEIEKKVLNKLKHPFVVALYYTFQDSCSLYFVLQLAKNGDLLACLRKLGSFNENVAQFYIAEIVAVTEYIHGMGVIHRDLKPENILLGEDGHIKLADFGTAKVIDEGETADVNLTPSKANSFVGTAEYVSPELLTDKTASKSSDLWAIGCLVYQLLAGRPPFKGSNEYQTFQKIIKMEYTIPEGFPEKAKDLVQKLLVTDPTKRLGAGPTGMSELRSHPFFEHIDWDTLPKQDPPKLVPYLPPVSNTNSDELSSPTEVYHVDKLTDLDLVMRFPVALADPTNTPRQTGPVDRDEVAELKKTSKWAPFLLDELIVYSGIVFKRKGLFSKRRQLILTDTPRLIYIDEDKMIQKGEIPFSLMHAELKTKRHFFVHTPRRTYYLEDPSGNASQWVAALQGISKGREGGEPR